MQNWKGETIETSGIHLDPTAFIGLQVEKSSKTNSEITSTTAVDTDSYHASALTDRSSKSKANSTELSWIDSMTRMEYCFLIKGKCEMGGIIGDGELGENGFEMLAQPKSS